MWRGRLRSEAAEGRVTSLGSMMDHHYIRCMWLLRLEITNLCLDPHSPAVQPLFVFIRKMSFTSTVKFKAQEIAPNLEPALEALLRSNEVHEDIIIAFRVQQIKDAFSLHCTGLDGGRLEEHV